VATADFRAQARAVRAEARKKLHEFRRERRAGIRAASETTPQAAACADAAPETAALQTAATRPSVPERAPQRLVTAPPQGSAPEAADFDRMQVSAVAAAFAEAAALRAAPGFAATPTANEERPEDDDAAPPVEQSDDSATAEEPAPVETTEPEPRGAPLDALPGVGPGLVWLLEKAGVRDVETLADSDAQALSERLGLVGRLVDVSALQTLARQASRAA
jgi:hypothetical protein